MSMSKRLFFILALMLSVVTVQTQPADLFAGGDPIFHREKSIIPFTLKGHKIYVPVKLQQSEKIYRFILDTGAFSSMGENIAEELGLNRGIFLEAGSKIKSAHLLKEGISIRLGDMELENFRIISMDYSYFYQTDPEIDGFLGSDFLKYFYVSIDYRKREFTLSRYPLSSAFSSRGHRVKLQTGNAASLPKFQCQVNHNWSWNGLIDSGAPYTIVFPTSLIDKQDWRNFPLIESIGVMASWPNSPIQKNYLTRISSLKIGELEFSNVPVIFANTEDIILGWELLSQFLIYLNYPDNEMILFPAGKIFLKSNYFSSGLILRKTADDRVIVEALWKGSPADQAGITIGSEATKINSHSTQILSQSDIEQILNDDRISAVELDFKDGYRERKITLKKAFLLPD